jgi:hypothetical protein
VDIEEVFLSSRLNTRLTFERKYFDFVSEAIGERTVQWDGSFDAFMQQFQVSDELLDGFRGFLEADSFSFEPDTFAVHQAELSRGIRAEFAHHLWGDEERYRIMIQDDPAVHRAKELLPQALAILAESRRIEEQRAAAQD